MDLEVIEGTQREYWQTVLQRKGGKKDRPRISQAKLAQKEKKIKRAPNDEWKRIISSFFQEEKKLKLLAAVYVSLY